MTILETPTNTTTLVDTGELHSGPAAGTATIFSVTAGQRRVTYAAVDGLAVFEGDIVLGALEEVQTPEDLEGIGTTGTLWLNATIPFEIDDALTDQRRVTDAIAHWHANTHLRFTPRSAQADFVRFVPSDATRSRVGRQGGRQDIEVSADAPTGSVIHEMGHTIGLWHEQSREDRNTFIDVRFDNIIPGEAHNFDQHITDGDDIGAYDFGSIMHYPRNAFSSNGQDTIVPRKELPPGVVMGQRNGLSAGDIAAVRALYPTGLWHPNSPGFAHSIQVGFRTSLTSWVTPTDNVQHIAYVGTDQKIQELFFRLGG
ncbi:Dot/Icm T4SS effector Zinc-dependent metalloprotease LegP, partial [Smaragdicoccus niigatensis]